MHLQHAIKEIRKLCREGKPDRELALEVLALAGAFFGPRIQHTVRIEQEGIPVLFYSTLPADEANFWRHPPLGGDMEKRQGQKGCRIIQLLEMDGYTGIWVMEDMDREIPALSDEAENLLWMVQMSINACLCSEAARENLKIDPVTGLPDKTAFLASVQEKVRNREEGFLIAAKVPVAPEKPFREDGLDEVICRLAGVCKGIQTSAAYRISADTVVVLYEGRQEEAFEEMQGLMTWVREAALFLAPISAMKQGQILTRIQRELARTGEGKAAVESAFPYPKLPVFQEWEDKGDGA